MWPVKEIRHYSAWEMHGVRVYLLFSAVDRPGDLRCTDFLTSHRHFIRGSQFWGTEVGQKETGVIEST